MIIHVDFLQGVLPEVGIMKNWIPKLKGMAEKIFPLKNRQNMTAFSQLSLGIHVQ